MEKFNEKDNNDFMSTGEAPAEQDRNNTYAAGTDDMPAGGPSGATAVRARRIGPLHISVICLVLICALLAGMTCWQTMRIDKVYSYIGENAGTDLSDWSPSGFKTGNHTIYDDTAVVKAYKENSSEGLSDKDAYVLKAAESVIDKVITDGMTDYEKELAIYNWLFGYTHYNDSAFAPLGSASSGGQTTDSRAAAELLTDVGQAAANGADEASANANSEGDSTEDPSDDPIASADPYRENYDYEPYGVLKYGSYICVGNATTFKLFMDMLDIPCQIIHSTEQGEHAWNLVQLDDEWYHVDLTFDSGSTQPFYSAFNVTDDIKLNAGYPWDTTEFPAATGTKYSYVSMNAIDISDIYTLPAVVRENIDEGRVAIPVRFTGDIKPSADELTTLMDRIAGYFNDAYMYVTEASDTSGDPAYLIQCEIYSDDIDTEEEPASEPSYDQAKMSAAIQKSFSDMKG